MFSRFVPLYLRFSTNDLPITVRYMVPNKIIFDSVRVEVVNEYFGAPLVVNNVSLSKPRAHCQILGGGWWLLIVLLL